MTNTNTGTAGEELVQRYLTEHGYPFEVEPDLGITKRPDFLITTPESRQLVVEVKSFDTYGPLAGAVPGQMISRSIGDVVRPIRAKIKEAAAQLSGLRDSGLPLVVVLANPAGRPVSLEPHIVISAMYGDLTYQAPLTPDGTMGELQAVAGRNGRLTNDHPYISAVAIARREYRATAWSQQWFDANRERFADDHHALIAAYAEAAQHAPNGDDVYLEVFETLSPTAVTLPRDILNGPRDLRWIPTPARDGLMPESVAVD